MKTVPLSKRLEFKTIHCSAPKMLGYRNDERMGDQVESNTPLNVFKAGGIKTLISNKKLAEPYIFIYELPPIVQFNICTFDFYSTGNLATSEEPDEMPHNVAFRRGLHCLQS